MYPRGRPKSIFRLRPKMKNALRSASSIHHKELTGNIEAFEMQCRKRSEIVLGHLFSTEKRKRKLPDNISIFFFFIHSVTKSSHQDQMFKTKTSWSKTKTKTFIFVLEALRDQEDYITGLIRSCPWYICRRVYILIYLLWMLVQYVQCARRERKNVITKITTTQNTKSSHTHRRMQTCYHQKNWYLTTRRVQRSVQPVKWHYAYHCHQHHADNYYTELYNG